MATPGTGRHLRDPDSEPDPHWRARLKYGTYPGAINVAAGASGLCQSTWVDLDRANRSIIIRLTFYDPALASEEKSRAARIAATEVLAWLGPEYGQWKVRVKGK